MTNRLSRFLNVLVGLALATTASARGESTTAIAARIDALIAARDSAVLRAILHQEIPIVKGATQRTRDEATMIACWKLHAMVVANRGPGGKPDAFWFADELVTDHSLDVNWSAMAGEASVSLAARAQPYVGSALTTASFQLVSKFNAIPLAVRSYLVQVEARIRNDGAQLRALASMLHPGPGEPHGTPAEIREWDAEYDRIAEIQGADLRVFFSHLFEATRGRLDARFKFEDYNPFGPALTMTYRRTDTQEIYRLVLDPQTATFSVVYYRAGTGIDQPIELLRLASSPGRVALACAYGAMSPGLPSAEIAWHALEGRFKPSWSASSGASGAHYYGFDRGNPVFVRFALELRRFLPRE